MRVQQVQRGVSDRELGARLGGIRCPGGVISATAFWHIQNTSHLLGTGDIAVNKRDMVSV